METGHVNGTKLREAMGWNLTNDNSKNHESGLFKSARNYARVNVSYPFIGVVNWSAALYNRSHDYSTVNVRSTVNSGYWAYAEEMYILRSVQCAHTSQISSVKKSIKNSSFHWCWPVAIIGLLQIYPTESWFTTIVNKCCSNFFEPVTCS